MLIECRGITKTYDNEGVKTEVLRGISFSLDAGEFVSIMGPSGSGKSTLLHILGLLDAPTSGDYFFSGESTAKMDEPILARLRNQRIGFVFQSFNLLPRTTVFENVEMPLLYDVYHGGAFSFSRRSIHREKVRAALASVGMEHRISYQGSQLSGGEKQRVAIARALINNPEVIFADEPTGNLDSKSGLQVMGILQDLNEQGKTIILVTHETYTAEHAHRIIRLMDGKIVSDETQREWRVARKETVLK